jgi:hypothetical protein
MLYLTHYPAAIRSKQLIKSGFFIGNLFVFDLCIDAIIKGIAVVVAIKHTTWSR